MRDQRSTDIISKCRRLGRGVSPYWRQGVEFPNDMINATRKKRKQPRNDAKNRRLGAARRRVVSDTGPRRGIRVARGVHQEARATLAEALADRAAIPERRAECGEVGKQTIMEYAGHESRATRGK